MAFLDFIKERHQARQQPAQNPQQEKPQTAKEMYTREAAGEKGKYTPAERMPEQEQAKVKEISSRMQSLGQGAQKADSSHAPAPVPAENSSSPEAMRQKMANQDKTAPALSPTSEQSGKTAAEKSNAPSRENSSSAQEKRASTTVPRRPPSWER